MSCEGVLVHDLEGSVGFRRVRQNELRYLAVGFTYRRCYCICFLCTLHDIHDMPHAIALFLNLSSEGIYTESTGALRDERLYSASLVVIVLTGLTLKLVANSHLH